jgi:CHAT domain-containing protein
MVELAQRCLMRGDPQGADIALRAAEAGSVRSGRWDEVDYARLLRVLVAVSIGQPDAASDILRAMSPHVGDVLQEGALELNDRGFASWEARIRNPGAGWGDPFFALFYLAIGRYCAATGHYSLALKALRRGLLYDRRAELAIGAPLRLAVSAALLERGDLQSALDELVRVRALGPQALNTYWPAVCELWSTWFVLTGQYGASLVELQTAAGWLSSQALEVPYWRALLNLANVRVLSGQFELAGRDIQFVRSAAAAARNEEIGRACDALTQFMDGAMDELSTGIPPIATLWGFGLIGGPPRGPAALVLDVPPASFLSGFNRSVAAFRRRLGSVPLGSSDSELVDIERQFGYSDSLIVGAELRISRAMLQQAGGDFAGALRAYQGVCPELVAAGLRPRLCVLLRLMADCETGSGGDPGPHLALSRRLFEQVVHSLPWHAQAAMLMSRSRLEDSYIERLAATIASQATPQRESSSPEILELMRFAYRNRRLMAGAEEIPAAADGAEPDPDSESALLCFLTFEDWSAAITVARGRAVVRRIPLTAEALRRHVADWHWHVRQQGTATERPETARSIEEISEQFSRDLGIDAILAELGPAIRHLRIRADGALRNLPVAAWRAGGSYLIERYATSLDPGVRRPQAGRGASMIVGAPVALGARGFDPPGEVADLAWLRQLPWRRRGAPEPRILSAWELTGETILGLLPSAGLFHFVGHGVFDPDRAEGTGLVLIAQEGSPVLLTLDAIGRSRCGSLQHATITACWGADSYALPGRCAEGIAEAFWRAGAGSVLSSLWPAETSAASLLTRAFTEEIGGCRRDEALQRAQRRMLENGYPVADWAGWQLLGDPTALVLAG